MLRVLAWRPGFLPSGGPPRDAHSESDHFSPLGEPSLPARPSKGEHTSNRFDDRNQAWTLQNPCAQVRAPSECGYTTTLVEQRFKYKIFIPKTLPHQVNQEKNDYKEQ